MDDPPALVPLVKDPALVRALRFVRALLVGGAATAADVTVLTLCIRVLHMKPELARIPALTTGIIVQFLGNRWFTFRASEGSFARHAKLFVLYESVAHVTNLLLFPYLLRRLPFLPPELTSFVGTFLVFALYSYPMRRLVIFRLLRDEVPPSAP